MSHKSRMTGRGLLTLYFVLCTLYLSSQTTDTSYARRVLDTLCSPQYHGRGYILEGHKKAADYINGQFEKIGLQKFKPNYQQYFNISINTFPMKYEVAVDGRKLEPSKHFLASASSKTLHQEFVVQKLNWKKVKKGKVRLKETDNTAYLIDATKLNAEDKKILKDVYATGLGAKVLIIVRNDKLTHRFSQTQTSFTVIDVQDSVVSEDLKKIRIDIDGILQNPTQTQNIIGYIPGTQYPDSFIVFSAHYDHLGRLGREGVYFPGANDNASGVAMLLSLAQYYKNNPSKYSIVFMAFGAEEVGLLGSEYYTKNPLFPLQNISFLVNMDIMGTGDEGIQIVNSTVFTKEFDLLKKINDQEQLLKELKTRGKAANSDHHWFSEKGVHAFFIYTLGGVSYYHDVFDKSETLPLTKFKDIFKLLVLFSNELEVK